MERKIRKLLALVLALSMCISLLNITTLAVESADNNPAESSGTTDSSVPVTTGSGTPDDPYVTTSGKGTAED